MVSRLGKYLLLEHVNQGGMADVFLAKTFGFGGADQLIALKCIRPEVQADHGFISMFIDEAKLSALLNHANIAKTYELGRISDSYFIAMEYVSGRDIRALIDRSRARGIEIPTALALFIVAAVLEGLDYAHRKTDLKGQALGIVHSDVSPKNVLVGYAGEVKLIDFGIARAAQGSTVAPGAHGAVSYMAPEQVRGESIDARSDIFAVGSLMFELLTRVRLFDGASDNVVRDKVRHAEIFPPTLIAPNLPADVEAIVMRALGRTVGERYANAEAMHHEVVEVMLRRYGHTQPRDLGNFLRKLFEDEYRADLGRIERAMQITAIPERVPEHRPGIEPTKVVNLATIAPLGEENTSPEATRFATILPSGAIITHPFAKPADAAAAGAAAAPPATTAPRPPTSPAPESSMADADVGSFDVTRVVRDLPPGWQSQGGAAATAAGVSAGATMGGSPQVSGHLSSGTAMSPTQGSSTYNPVTSPAAAVAPVTAPVPPVMTPTPALAPLKPPPLAAPRPQPLSEVEPTDVDEGPDSDTAVVMRDGGTDPNVVHAGLDAAQRARRGADDDDDPTAGDTAIVRTDGTRIGTLLDSPQQDDDDYTDRIHKSLAILGINEDSDANIEPTQVAFKADTFNRSSSGSSQIGSPARSQPASAGQTTDPQTPALSVRRETVERLQSIGISGPATGSDDEEDSTDRVLRSSGGSIEQVPREITVIDHSRRAAVDDWAREARGQRRSSLRRAVIVGFVLLLVGAGIIGGLWLRRGGQLRIGNSAPALGSLVIISHPVGAEVLIDGKVVGTTPFSSPKIAPGAHQVVVRSVAGKLRTLDVFIKEHEVVTREVNLAD